MRRHAAAFSFLLASLAAGPAGAKLPSDGMRITSSDYAIDLGQTPVLSGNRVTALAGAFVAIAEGTDGSAQNPAGVALRAPWSGSYFDIDVGLGFTLSSTLPDSDLFNSGQEVLDTSGGEQSFMFLGVAANLQFGPLAFGVASDVQRYTLRRAGSQGADVQRDELAATFAVTHLTGAYAFYDGQILAGGGTRTITLNVDNENAPGEGEQDLFAAFGTGFEAGVLLRPNDAPYRVGLTFRSAVTANAEGPGRTLYADDPENALVLPRRVTLPWELNAGVAVQLGPRPFNPRWINPRRKLAPLRAYHAWRAEERERLRAANPDPQTRKRLDSEAERDEAELERAEEELDEQIQARYASMERFFVLLSGSLLVLGSAEDAVGVESFLERTVQRSGRKPSFSPRLGVETELLPNWTRIRGGTYLEPSRFESNPEGARWHATFGLEQRLFPWTVFGLLGDDTVFRINASLDIARAYTSWGFAIGLWH